MIQLSGIDVDGDGLGDNQSGNNQILFCLTLTTMATMIPSIHFLNLPAPVIWTTMVSLDERGLVSRRLSESGQIMMVME
jgi:hypothetical protein